MTKLLATKTAARKSSKGISLSKSAKVFDTQMFDLDCQPQDIILNIPEVVSTFTESTGVQILARAECKALTIIPGMGVVDLTKSSRAAAKVMVSLTLPEGSKIQNGYIYTPAIEGKTRWFDCRLVKYTETEGRISIQADKKSVKQRGLLHLVTA